MTAYLLAGVYENLILNLNIFIAKGDKLHIFMYAYPLWTDNCHDTKLSWLAAPQCVVMTKRGAAIDNTVGIMTTLGCSASLWRICFVIPRMNSHDICEYNIY